MNPRQQSAGTAGIVAGIALFITFVLYFTSGATPETFGDPGKALPYITQNLGRLRAVAVFAVITLIPAVFFVAGLAGKLHDRTPTRATGVLYFGILGTLGYAIGALVFWAAVPALAAYAAKDQVGAGHAWLALNALTNAVESVGNLFVGISILLAGWAIAATGVFSSMLGWYGVVTGVVNVLAVLVPGYAAFFIGTFVLTSIWLIWAGSALRRAAA